MRARSAETSVILAFGKSEGHRESVAGHTPVSISRLVLSKQGRAGGEGSLLNQMPGAKGRHID